MPTIDDPPYTPSKDAANVLLWPDPRSTSHTDIVSCVEIFAGREGTGFSAGNYHRNYVRKFRATTKAGGLFVADQDTLDETDILSDGRLPRPFGSYFSNWRNVPARPGLPPVEGQSSQAYADIDALAVDFHAAREQQDDSSSWIVTVRYSTDVGPEGPDYRFMFGGTQFGEDVTRPESPQFKPWLVLPTFEYSYVEATVAKQWDRDGKPFRNSAEQPLAPAPTVEISYPVITMTRNERTFTPDMGTTWAYAVNDATFMGYPAECVQILPPAVKPMRFGKKKYYRVSWRFRFKPDESAKVWNPATLLAETKRVTWQPLFLDAGYYQLSDPLGALPQSVVPIYRQSHRVSGQPALLDGKGRAVPKGGDPVFLKYNSYQSRNFTLLFNASMVP